MAHSYPLLLPSTLPQHEILFLSLSQTLCPTKSDMDVKTINPQNDRGITMVSALLASRRLVVGCNIRQAANALLVNAYASSNGMFHSEKGRGGRTTVPIVSHHAN